METGKELIGREVAGFRITKSLGDGGMALVVQGENKLDPRLRRALKVIRPELAGREEFRKRFIEEARTLEHLQHTNVVKFFGLRHADDLWLMELELLEGQSLAATLQAHRGGLVPISEVTRWLSEASAGVAAAHGMGVVHRDLKPDNLFLTREGTVKVLDFGLARALDEAERAMRMTRTGFVPGTVLYMAPEVCNGEVAGPPADVYALGLTLLECLVGHHPFVPSGSMSPSGPQIMLKHVQGGLPRVRVLRPDVSEALEAVVARATATEPGQRYPNALVFGRELRTAAAGSGGRAGHAPASVPLGTSVAWDARASSGTAASPRVEAQALGTSVGWSTVAAQHTDRSYTTLPSGSPLAEEVTQQPTRPQEEFTPSGGSNRTLWAFAAALIVGLLGAYLWPKPRTTATVQGVVTPGGPVVEYPVWVINDSGAFDADKKTIFGVGSSSGIRNHSLARTNADNRARSEVQKVFEAYSARLLVEFGASDVSRDSLERQTISDGVKTISAEALNGVQIIDHWIHPVDGTIYALADLDLEVFIDRLSKAKQFSQPVREQMQRSASSAFAALVAERAKFDAP